MPLVPGVCGPPDPKEDMGTSDEIVENQECLKKETLKLISEQDPQSDENTTFDDSINKGDSGFTEIDFIPETSSTSDLVAVENSFKIDKASSTSTEVSAETGFGSYETTRCGESCSGRCSKLGTNSSIPRSRSETSYSGTSNRYDVNASEKTSSPDINATKSASVTKMCPRDRAVENEEKNTGTCYGKSQIDNRKTICSIPEPRSKIASKTKDLVTNLENQLSEIHLERGYSKKKPREIDEDEVDGLYHCPGAPNTIQTMNPAPQPMFPPPTLYSFQFPLQTGNYQTHEHQPDAPAGQMFGQMYGRTNHVNRPPPSHDYRDPTLPDLGQLFDDSDDLAEDGEIPAPGLQHWFPTSLPIQPPNKKMRTEQENGVQTSYWLQQNAVQMDERVQQNAVDRGHRIQENGIQVDHRMQQNAIQMDEKVQQIGHPKIQTGIQVDHSIQQNGIQVDHSIQQNGIQVVHSIQQNGIQVDHSIQQNGIQVDHSIQQNGIQVDHSIQQNGLQVDHSIQQNGIQVVHSIQQNGDDWNDEHVENDKDDDGETIFHHILAFGDDEFESILNDIVRSLGDNIYHMINIQKRRSQTPLYCSVELGKHRAAEMYLRFGANPNIQGSQFDSDTKGFIMQGPIHKAVDMGDVRMVETLLNSPALDVNAKRVSDRKTALMVALQKHISGCPWSDRTQIVHLLVDRMIESGTDFSEVNSSSGRSALMYAIESKDVDVVKHILMAVGLQVARELINTQNKDGNTCMHIMAGLKNISPDKHVKMGRLLLEFGGQQIRNHEKPKGSTPDDWNHHLFEQIRRTFQRR